MTLFETATKLQVRLEAASAADAGDELLSRGRTIRDQVVSAAEHMEAVQSYRTAMDTTNAPAFDTKNIRKAIGGFRGALSRSGLKALQQQSAATLEEALATETKRLDRWVASSWKRTFLSAGELLSREEGGGLHGSPRHRRTARNRARTIRAVRHLDPVRERPKLEEMLKVQGLSACLDRVTELIAELDEAIVAIDQEQAAMTPEVRAALQSAASDDGLPLGELTPDLFIALRTAGVLDDLVVRRS